MLALRNQPLFVLLLGITSLLMYVPVLFSIRLDQWLYARTFFYHGTFFLIITTFLGIAFSSQKLRKKIVQNIFDLLDQAIPNLNNTTNSLAVSGDVVYGGNMTKWVKAANSIKARAALQLSLKDGNAAYTAALAAAANGFTSNADDYKVPFDSDDQNPIYQFMDQRTDIRMCSTFVDLLASNDDPRLPFYVAEDADGNYVGSVPGSETETASRPGDAVAAEDAPTYMMTFAELKFIQAEANLALGNLAPAQAAALAAALAPALAAFLAAFLV